MEITMHPIGYIRTSYKDDAEIPRQYIYGYDQKGTIELLEEYREGIKDIEEGSYGVILFYFHQSEGYSLVSKRRNNKGIYSTRSPHRPNGIGMSIVKFTKIEGTKMEFLGVDMLDGTPVLDIKPYAEDLNPKL